jgi:hypothetical protein
MDRQIDEQTDMMKLIDCLRNLLRGLTFTSNVVLVKCRILRAVECCN